MPKVNYRELFLFFAFYQRDKGPFTERVEEKILDFSIGVLRFENKVKIIFT